MHATERAPSLSGTMVRAFIDASRGSDGAVPAAATGADDQAVSKVTKDDVHVYLVDSPATVAAMISSLSNERVLAVDAEGVDLGAKNGELSIIQLVGESKPTAVYLVDVTTLGEGAFSYAEPCTVSARLASKPPAALDCATEKSAKKCAGENAESDLRRWRSGQAILGRALRSPRAAVPVGCRRRWSC